MNSKLAEYYLGMHSALQKKMEGVSYLKIIPALEEYFKGTWAYEITNETVTPDSSIVFTSVALYTPGRIYTGHSVCKIKDCGFSHLFALLDACQVFMDMDGLSQKEDPSEPDGKDSTYNMSPEEIMDTINNGKADTSAKKDNYKDEHNMPAEEIPIDSTSAPEPYIPPNGESVPVLEPPHEGGSVPDYDTPKPELHGFSQHQIDRMNAFKSKVGILNSTMWGNYVKMWSGGKMLEKKDIVPANVENFLGWAEKVSENM